MNEYAIKQAGVAGLNASAPPPKDTVDTLVRTLSDRLQNLASEVIFLSERIHGAQSGTAGTGGLPSPAIQAWADELRDAAGPAHARGEYAMKEIFRIRETLGL